MLCRAICYRGTSVLLQDIIFSTLPAWSAIEAAILLSALKNPPNPLSFLRKSGCVKQKPYSVGTYDNSPVIHRWEWTHRLTHRLMG